MKKTFLLVVALFLITLGFSQTKIERPKSIAGGEIFLPIGELSENYDVGFCTSLQIGIKESNNYSLFLGSGYNYIFGKGRIASLIQFPANVGGYYQISELVAVGSSLGVIYTREKYSGFNFNFSNSIRFNYDVVNLELKYSSTVIKGSKNDLNGVSIKFSYVL